jgi:hypothetical protein
MKKILVVVMAMVMMLAMASCGGGEEAKVYAGYYSANIPDSFTVNEYESEFVRDSEISPGSEDKIKVEILTGTAEDEIASSLAFWKGAHKQLDDVTYGDITWKVETFKWNDGADSCTFYTDIEDSKHVEVTFFMLGADSEEVISVMESFIIQEGAYDKNQEFLGSF